jgi:hypothetical protein
LKNFFRRGRAGTLRESLKTSKKSRSRWMLRMKKYPARAPPTWAASPPWFGPRKISRLAAARPRKTYANVFMRRGTGGISSWTTALGAM